MQANFCTSLQLTGYIFDCRYLFSFVELIWLTIKTVVNSGVIHINVNLRADDIGIFLMKIRNNVGSGVEHWLSPTLIWGNLEAWSIVTFLITRLDKIDSIVKYPPIDTMALDLVETASLTDIVSNVTVRTSPNLSKDWETKSVIPVNK